MENKRKCFVICEESPKSPNSRAAFRASSPQRVSSSADSPSFFSFSFIFHFVFFFYRGNISSRPQRASCPAGSHCFRAKLLLDQSDSWHSDLRCYQTNMVIGHELILPSSVFLGRTSCLITQSGVLIITSNPLQSWLPCKLEEHYYYYANICQKIYFESEAKRTCG